MHAAGFICCPNTFREIWNLFLPATKKDGTSIHEINNYFNTLFAKTNQSERAVLRRNQIYIKIFRKSGSG